MSRLVLRETTTGKEFELAREASLKIRAKGGEKFAVVDKDTGEEVTNLEFSLANDELGIVAPDGQTVVIENFGRHKDSFPACPGAIANADPARSGDEAIAPEALKAELIESVDGSREAHGDQVRSMTLSGGGLVEYANLLDEANSNAGPVEYYGDGPVEYRGPSSYGSNSSGSSAGYQPTRVVVQSMAQPDPAASRPAGDQGDIGGLLSSEPTGQEDGGLLSSMGTGNGLDNAGSDSPLLGGDLGTPGSTGSKGGTLSFDATPAVSQNYDVGPRYYGRGAAAEEEEFVATGLSGEAGSQMSSNGNAIAMAAFASVLTGGALAMTGLAVAKSGAARAKPRPQPVEENHYKDDYASYYAGLGKYNPGDANYKDYAESDEKLYGANGKIVKDAVDKVIEGDNPQPGDDGNANGPMGPASDTSSNSIMPAREGEGSSIVKAKLGLTLENGLIRADLEDADMMDDSLRLVWLRDGELVMDGDKPLTGTSYVVDPVKDAGKTITCELRAKDADDQANADDTANLNIARDGDVLRAELDDSGLTDPQNAHYQWFKDGVLVEEGVGLTERAIDPQSDAGSVYTVKAYQVDVREGAPASAVSGDSAEPTEAAPIPEVQTASNDDAVDAGESAPRQADVDSGEFAASAGATTLAGLEAEDLAPVGDLQASLSRLGSIRIGEIDGASNHSEDAASIRLSGFSGFESINIGAGPGGSGQIIEIDGASVMDNVDAGGVLRVGGVQGSQLKLAEGHIGEVIMGIHENGVEKVSLEYIVNDSSYTILVDEALYNGGSGVI